MPFLDPPEPIQTRIRLLYRPGPTLVLVLVGSVGAGAGLVAAGQGWIAREALGSGPRGLLSLLGGSFLATGLLLGMRAAESARRLLATRGARPAWRRDHPWPATGRLPDDRWPALRVEALGLVALLLVLALLNGAVLHEPGRVPLAAWLVLGALDVAALLVLPGLALRLLRRARHGAAHLALDRLPVAPGEVLAGWIELPRSLEGLRAGDLTLDFLCIRERARWTGAGRSRTVGIQTHALWRERWVPGPGDLDGLRVRVRREVPAAGASTCLSARVAHYWELRIGARRRGPDYEAAFLVPVYRDAGETAAPGPTAA